MAINSRSKLLWTAPKDDMTHDSTAAIVAPMAAALARRQGPTAMNLPDESRSRSPARRCSGALPAERQEPADDRSGPIRRLRDFPATSTRLVKQNGPCRVGSGAVSHAALNAFANEGFIYECAGRGGQRPRTSTGWLCSRSSPRFLRMAENCGRRKVRGGPPPSPARAGFPRLALNGGFTDTYMPQSSEIFGQRVRRLPVCTR